MICLATQASPRGVNMHPPSVLRVQQGFGYCPSHVFVCMVGF